MESYSVFSFKQIAFSFLTGIRFDFSSIFLLNILFIAVYFIPKPTRLQNNYYYIRGLSLLFYITNIPFIILNFVDGEYYKFSGKRTSLGILGIANDVQEQIIPIIIDFLPKVLLSIFTCYLFYYLTKKYFYEKKEIYSGYTRQVFLFLSIAIITIIASRGGFQSKVIRPAHAFSQGNVQLGHLTQNTTFTILKSNIKNNLARMEYMSKKNILNLISPALSTAGQTLNPNNFKFNIVLIALEGFSTDYWGYSNENKGFTPFLDSLAKKSVFFKNHFANGRRSIEAFPALFLGMPSLAMTPIPISQYINNRFYGLASALSEIGYDNAFFHGANYNSSHTHNVSRIAGFNKLYSRDDYPNPSDYNGAWGISDGPFLKFYANEMDKLKEPFVTATLTLSSHQPFVFPKEFENQIEKIDPPILRTILYTDLMIKEFFELAKTKSWYKNTLFVITGDHTSQTKEFEKSTSGLGFYRVPMMFFSENENLKLAAGAISNKVTQHLDFSPTIFDLLNHTPKKRHLFGQSMFSDEQNGRVLTRISHIFQYANKDYIVRHLTQETGTEGFYVFKAEHKFKEGEEITHSLPPPAKVIVDELKAYIQYYNDSMIDNSLYKWQ